ncbi:hypothetical protein LJK87_24580 [Paenibacillus sp. P25]|nr:hypothetical protein LJK87_24580 [Paenibacillus sp. P25]
MKAFPTNIRLAYGNLRIKHKVFALISLTMAVCFLITYLSLQYVYSIYDGRLYSKSSQPLNLSSSGIENELKKLDKLSFTIATDLQIQNRLTAIDETTPEFEKYRLRADISDKLVQYSGYEKYIYSIEIRDLQGGQSLAGQSLNPSPSKMEMILSESAKGSGRTEWIYPDREDTALIAAREIRSYQNYLSLNRLGTLIIRIRFDKVVEDVVAGTELKNGEMRISSGRHTVYPVNTELREEQATGDDKRGYLIKELNGRSYFITQIQSGYSGWTYHSLIPFDQIFNKIVLMKKFCSADLSQDSLRSWRWRFSSRAASPGPLRN